MHLCYIDESGCTGGVPDPASVIQPVFVLAGLMLPHQSIKQLTVDWINLKQKHFPNLLANNPAPRYHDWMAAEVKGSELRKMAKASSRNKRRFATNFLTHVLGLLEHHHARIAGRVFVKPVGGGFSGTAVYTSTAQGISASFQSYLEAHHGVGIIIADSRNKPANAIVSHSIFTQRHSVRGDPYPLIVEAPTFGHSDNHAGLQLADILCSALLFPIAAQVCSSAHLTNHMHCDPHFLELRKQFGARVKALQWLYVGQTGQQRGGISMKDQMNGHPASVLFTTPAQPVPNALAAAFQAAASP